MKTIQFKHLTKHLALALSSVSIAALYGCGGGGGGSSPAAPAVDAQIAVSPSLGRISAGTRVAMFKLDGSLISEGTVGADGKCSLSLAGYKGAILMRVIASKTTTYFDEKSKTDVLMGDGKTLSAMAVQPGATLGVTPLTNAAVKLLEGSSGGLAGASNADVLASNKKISDHFPDVADILAPPKIVDANTKNSLDVAGPDDKYALLLAALATSSNSNAQDASDALATDLKDGKLDGLDASSATPTAPLAGYVPANLATAYQAAAKGFANDSSQLLIAKLPPTIVIDSPPATAVVTPPKTSLEQAKDMFAEFRTTKNSASNNAKDGFLDVQNTRMSNDAQNNVAPEMSRVTDRLYYLNRTVKGFESASGQDAGNDAPFIIGNSPDTNLPTLTRTRGNPSGAWYNNEYLEFCWADSLTPANVTITKCAISKKDPSYANGLVRIVLAMTRTATNQYTYTTIRKLVPLQTLSPNVTFGPSIAFDVDGLGNVVPNGAGTLVKTFTAAKLSKYDINGTLSASAITAAGNLATGVDNIAVTAEKTLVSGNIYRTAVQGSVSTDKLNAPGKTVTIALSAGSYIDTDETNPSNILPVGAKFIGNAKTLDSDFTGIFDFTDFSGDQFNVNRRANRIVFAGTVTDTSSGGAGQILKGIVDVNTIAGYPLYNSQAAETAANFLRSTVSFTGIVQMPNRPELKLVLAAVRSAQRSGSISLNYSYGSVSLTASGPYNDAAVSQSLTLSNQDGIVWVASSGGTGVVSKSGTQLATISNGVIHYIDGVSESLN